MSLLIEIVELLRKNINNAKPNISDIMLAAIINIARVEVSLCAIEYCYNIEQARGGHKKRH